MFVTFIYPDVYFEEILSGERESKGLRSAIARTAVQEEYAHEHT